MTSAAAREQILVIKHGALGDTILATGPFQAIRTRHPDAHITLFTTKPFAGLLKDAPYFDEIWIDTRPKPWHFTRFMTLMHQLRARRFHWVYDLQTSSRSTGYFNFFLRPKPNYSGLHPKGSHPHNTPERTRLHTIDRQKQQLAIAGIDYVPPPNIDWLKAYIGQLLPAQSRYILLVPGGSAHRPEKRWPPDQYAQLAQLLIEKDYLPVLIGAGAEAELLAQISASHPAIINLCNQTSYAQIAELARHAVYAVGNDTGPMHIIAAAGCPSTVIFNITASNPALCAPRGSHVTIIEADNLQRINAGLVLDKLL